ncbi:MAG: hypothetical protein MJ193_00995 [Clostridia bacterium]|nr:hypothetical protein [Clostridia bacterium]
MTEAPFCDVYLTQGFVDIHTHGAMGIDFSRATQDDINEVEKYYLSHGVTHFVPTFVATPLEILDGQLNSLFALKSKCMLKAHMEGPFISLKHKGAQPACNIYSEFKDDDAKFFEKNRDKVGIVTLCPAVKNAENLVKTLVANGIKAQGGHDDSRLPDIKKTMSAGLDGVTHIFCGCSMAERGKRDFDKLLGLTESGLYYDELTVEVIADDKHISKELFLFILKCKGFKNICLISDSLSAAGMEKGFYKLGNDNVFTDGKVCYLEDYSALAGSVTSVGEMVKIVCSYGIPIEHAAYMASDAPKNYIGLDNKKFVIGEKADYVLLSKDGSVIETYFA